MTSNATVVITAAVGLTGSSIIKELAKGSKAPTFSAIHGITHPASHAPELVTLGASVHGVDANDHEGLVLVMKKADVLIIIPTEDENGKRINHGKQYIQAARDAQVKAVILYSAVGCENPEAPYLHQFFELEQYLQNESNIPVWTVVRCNFYMQNLLFFAKELGRTDVIHLPVGDDPMHSKCAMVDVRDVAEVFASLSAQPRGLHTRHCRQIYSITSETPLTAENIQQYLMTVVSPECRVSTQISLKDVTEYLHSVGQEDRQFLHQLNTVRLSHPKLSEAVPTSPLTKTEIQRIVEYFSLWQSGKLNFLSLDMYHITGRSATSLYKFFSDYYTVFRQKY